MAGKPNDELRPIIIVKKIKKVEGGHHGGAWKVAYADFVTAMMSFFLLLWLLNVTTDEQKMLISSYFAPADPRVATSTSGAGGVMGGTSMAVDGAMTTNKSPIMAMQQDPAEGVGRHDGEDADKAHDDTQVLSDEEINAAKSHEEQREKELGEKQDKEAFEKAKEEIQQALKDQPELKEIGKQLLVEITPEGLQFTIMDLEGKPMFELGSAKPLPAAEKLIAAVTKVLLTMPNQISIRGHTDAKPYGKDAVYTNWELSADRANAARRLILADGMDIKRIENVQGLADKVLLVQDDPQSSKNRRISIIALKQSIAKPDKKLTDATPKPVIPPPPVKKGPDIKKYDPGIMNFP